MIQLINRVKKIRVNEKKIQSIVAVMLDVLKYADFDIGILFTTNRSIRILNREYRQKDKPTDVLSFPFHPDLVPGSRIKAQSSDDKNLGDIIISLEYLKKDCSRWERSFDDHLIVILAHGIAHLLNYDHQTDEEYEQMQKVERRLLKAAKVLQ